MQLFMHSYTFRDYPLGEALANARRFGWEGIELQPCHFNREKIDVELPAAMKMAKRFEVPIKCVDFGGNFVSDDAGEVEACVRQMEREIEVCAENGVRLMNGGIGSLVVDDVDWGKNGSALAKDVHYERAAEAFRHLGALAGKKDIRITFEIHMNAIHDTIASTARLLDMIALDNVMANPDCGNMFAVSTAEKDPDSLDLLGDRIGYFHFKNCVPVGNGYNFSVRLADGYIDVSKWFAKLVSIKYNGPICVEYCGEGDPHAAAELDLLYVRKTLEWLMR